jgi:hypothetical protein
MDAESQLLAEKDAEIERLKALVTELAEALERIPVVLTPPDRELVHRARVATKGATNRIF